MEMTNVVLNKVFFNDGSLRDIYVVDVNLTDWQRFFDWIRTSTWDIVFYKDGFVTVYEETDVAHFFEEKENHRILMSINTNGVFINCHFFSEDEIEFDIDPKEVKSKTEAKAVFEFMKNLSKILHKESILTGEYSPEYPLVTVNPDGTLMISAC
ncbi:hypothetical protein [Bacillus sp. ISL-7]|uniref:hypothetical protein n=1 Tax=Bacillus sp. ISL-7 TaxID=2819136 RepID=UPI001BECB98C|nr:hypothetical protein [Bacillus sp. ISL-7]MBT2739026.1 hypothetical protein [Bacillus sp. ISL-7]